MRHVPGSCLGLPSERRKRGLRVPDIIRIERRTGLDPQLRTMYTRPSWGVVVYRWRSGYWHLHRAYVALDLTSAIVGARNAPWFGGGSNADT